MADGQNTSPSSGNSTFDGAGNPVLEMLASLNAVAQGVGTTAGNIFDTVSGFKQNIQLKKLERKQAEAPPPSTTPSFQISTISQWFSNPANKNVAIALGTVFTALFIWMIAKKRK